MDRATTAGRFILPLPKTETLKTCKTPILVEYTVLT